MFANSVRRMLADIRGVAGASSPTHAHLRDRLVAMAVLTVVVDLVASAAMLMLERHVGRTEIHDFGDAAFFTSAQLSTVSSSMANPLSPAGRVLNIFLELYAITVVGALAGSFAAFFHRRGRERDAEAGAAGQAP